MRPSIAARYSDIEPASGAVWRAIEPTSARIFFTHVHYFLGRYDAALAWANQAARSNPHFARLYRIRTATLAQLGRNDEAKAALEDFNQVFPDRTISRLRPNYRWKNAADIDHFMDGLRTAGLPE